MIVRPMKKNGRSRRELLLLGGLAALLVLALFDRALLFGETFGFRDLRVLHRPERAILAPLARASSGLPLWNPLTNGGQPFAANPANPVFHPLTALFLLLPFEWAFRLNVILPLVFAGAFQALFLRTIGCSRAAAAFGALSFGVGGYALSATSLFPTLLTFFTLPLVASFGIRTARKGAPRDVVGLALSLGLACLGGEPGLLLGIAATLTALFVVQLRSVSRAERIRRSIRGVFGAGLGIAIGAALLLPAIHFASKTTRAATLDAATAGAWSMPPVRVAEILSPNVLGHVERPDERWYWGRCLYPAKGFPFILSIYSGLLVPVLAVVALSYRARFCLVFAALSQAGFALSLGAHSPAWTLARRIVPILGAIRYPERFVVFGVWPLVVIAAIGFDRILFSRRARRTAKIVLMGLAGFGLAAATACLVVSRTGGEGGWRSLGVPGAIAPAFGNMLAWDACRLALFGSGFVALLGLGGRSVRRVLAPSFLALAALDLALAGRPLVPTVPISQVALPPRYLRPLLQQTPTGRVFHEAAWDLGRNTAPVVCRPPIPEQWGIALELCRDDNLYELRLSAEATAAFRRVLAAEPGRLEPMLRRRGVGAILRFRAGLPSGPGASLQNAGAEPIQVVPVADPSPLAFVPSRVERVSGASGWEAAVLRLGASVATTACLAEPVAAGIPESPSPARVVVREATPVRVVLEAESDGPQDSIVAVNQTWDDGWKVRVDGRIGPLLRTDMSLSAVAIPAGRHTVELEYGDPWLRTGVFISAASLVACFLLARFGRLVPRGPPGHDEEGSSSSIRRRSS